MGGGRKKQRLQRRLAQEVGYDKSLSESYHSHSHEQDAGSSHMSAKQMAKKHKKCKHAKKHQVPITKEHRWHLIKVYDSSPPSREFLYESFLTLLDTEFTMLGFHHSTTSARFYLENNTSAAMSLKSMNKRMQGSKGRLMQIGVEHCRTLLLLNAQQIALAKQVLEKRFDASSCILDLSNFHYDPLFLEHNILPVLWDPAIFKQILLIVRDNVPNLKGIVLSKNGLKLLHVKVLAGNLGKCPLQGINLEQNDIENIKELINTLSVYPVIELKLEGNNCLKDIRNPIAYIRTVQCKLPHLKTLDGVDIVSYLVSSTKDSNGENNVLLRESGASTSNAPEVPRVDVTEALLKQFISEYYLCIDTEHRLQLVNAYTPTATLQLDSELPNLPSVMISGQEQIKEVLSALPATRHDKESFSYKPIDLRPSAASVEVTGQLQIQGHEGVVSFMHTFNIVPYNTGLGCTMSKLSLI